VFIDVDGDVHAREHRRGAGLDVHDVTGDPGMGIAVDADVD
jgi:hypothetical protein